MNILCRLLSMGSNISSHGNIPLRGMHWVRGKVPGGAPPSGTRRTHLIRALALPKHTTCTGEQLPLKRLACGIMFPCHSSFIILFMGCASFSVSTTTYHRRERKCITFSKINPTFFLVLFFVYCSPIFWERKHKEKYNTDFSSMLHFSCLATLNRRFLLYLLNILMRTCLCDYPFLAWKNAF